MTALTDGWARDTSDVARWARDTSDVATKISAFQLMFDAVRRVCWFDFFLFADI